jgi:crossover junction endodeoxyribonuclease RuvC
LEELMNIIGIDPGQSGGIALINESGDVEAWKMGETERDTLNTIREACYDDPLKCFAYIEKVGAMPKQGVSSTFKFGQNYGFLRGCLIALGIPFETVTPQKWQGFLHCRSRGDKNVTKAKAQELYPQLKITHAVADALLIAEYGRRIRIGG